MRVLKNQVRIGKTEITRLEDAVGRIAINKQEIFEIIKGFYFKLDFKNEQSAWDNQRKSSEITLRNEK